MTQEQLQEYKQQAEKMLQCTLADEQIIEPTFHKWIASCASKNGQETIVVMFLGKQVLLMLSRAETIRLFHWMRTAQ